jgi:hypothetical protein
MNASAYIVDGSELEKKIKERVEHLETNVSAYVRKCIENDLASRFTATNKTAILDLAKIFHPSLTGAFEKEFNQLDQPRIIARILEALELALKIPGFNPVERFQIYNDKSQLEAMIGTPDFMARLIDAISKSTSQLPHAAEEQAPYPAKTKIETSTIKALIDPAKPNRETHTR